MNYFNYFTEIEEHFQRQRGAQIYLSPVDWALIAAWQEAGIPLAAVLRGIDQAFEKFNSGQRRDAQRPRALVYCAAAVLAAAEAMRDAGAGAADQPTAATEDAGFSRERIAAFLASAEAQVGSCAHLDPASPLVQEVRATLGRLSGSYVPGGVPMALEELDRVLTVLDDKLHAALLQSASVEAMVAIRAEIAREIAPYRRKLRPEQIAMIERQFQQRRLLERAGLPRLSLFYMP